MHLTLCTSIVLIYLFSIDSNSMEKQGDKFWMASNFIYSWKKTTDLIFELTSNQISFKLRQNIINPNNTR